ncbi:MULTISPECIES: phosphoglycerate mutase family protein [Bacillus]|uniref:Histidine phosphatase family protein n=2 Tax=Bacillus cereus group TaxID=86661 RepID=A0A2A7D951_BACAN|nr:MULTISPECIES: phosphoglycerate mutase family protein [Bacillus]MCP1165485.1 histidine phosphatase family protein [Bacillus sp. 1813sda1]MDC7975997.1 phosphoglycerate mutase family protein [Bacillus sp. BLCC-B18]OTW66261.1 histidine phosphatase family protein [Bacillus thuringiensis serovar coreanensis]OTX43461.1 histidine phosphatase family protein [Bacillus thuringiensis serovar sooncheon]OTX51768.1 histidine phosphatase family protein [Bacillus thuringiensis serovar guiyangiensis]
MKLVFVRHGEGEHTKNLPGSLQVLHPSLTDEGRNQAKLLQYNVPLQETDILVASPAIRTLQTATIWSEKLACQKVVHPYVSPRIFPYREGAKTLPCDHIVDQGMIANLFPHFSIEKSTNKQLWTGGINTISENRFRQIVDEFLLWCYELGAERICIVSHDGTITAYRQYLQKIVLTRSDFLQETGIYEMDVAFESLMDEI